MILHRMRFFPFLFALHPIVATYVQVDKAFSIVSVGIASLCFLACTFILYLVLMRFFDKDRVAIALSVMWIWSFSYTSFRSLAGFNGPHGWVEKILIPAWIAVFAVACLLILKRKEISNTFNRYFTALGIVVVLIALWPPPKDSRSDFRPSEVINLTTSQPDFNRPPDSLPDIYYVILDEYPSSSALKDVLDIDNSEFVGFLREKGFFVADRSHSNYSYTLASLSSTLNMQYLPMKSLGGDNYEVDCNSKSLVNSIRESLVLNFLISRGYQFVDLSIWPELEGKSNYFYDHNYRFLDRFAMELLHRTVLSRPVVENVVEGLDERKSDRMKLRALIEIPRLSAPTFTYVHLWSTHEPYVLDDKGNTLGLWKRVFESWNDKSRFRDQLRFVTDQVRGAIEYLLDNSRRPPIIIVQGDHGPILSGESRDLRLSILNALYLPGVRTDSLPRSISSVNTFRLLFDRYFDTRLDLLEERHYYPTGRVFTEVSASYGR